MCDLVGDMVRRGVACIHCVYIACALSGDAVTCKAACSCRELDDIIECRVEKVRSSTVSAGPNCCSVSELTVC